MQINTKVVSDKFEDEIVVVSLDTGFYYSFRKSAVEIWSLIEKGLSSTQIISAFGQVSYSEQQEIKDFLRQLLDEKLIVENELTDNDHAIPNKIEFTEIEFAKFEDMSDLIMIDPIHDADQEKGWPHQAKK